MEAQEPRWDPSPFVCRRDGYVATSLHRAKNVSWAATFVVLLFLATFAKKFGDMPSEFFIYLSVAVMTAVFAVTFFVLDWTGVGEDSENEEELSSRA